MKENSEKEMFVAVTGSIMTGVHLYGPKESERDIHELMLGDEPSERSWQVVPIELVVGSFTLAIKQHFTIATGNPFDAVGFTEIFDNHNDALIYAEEHYKHEPWTIVQINSDLPTQ